MGLLVLVLRSYLVFQNIYVTYKTLKLPPPSSRNGGKPTIRAMTQRKRDMKGCMSIWIVWCCLAAYESAVERLVSIFIPFYDEIKSVVLVLFILARARGAEPIYLHVIRPFLKPYVSTLDAMLDILHSLGDFVLLVLSAPLSPLFAWWRSRFPSSSQSDRHADSSTDRTDPPPPYAYPAQSDLRDGPVDVQASMTKFYATGNPPGSSHEVWRPPPASYDNDRRDVPMPMPEPSIPSFGNPGEAWQSYPSHPSAYPPIHTRPNNVHMPQPSPDYIDGDRPGFHRSLLPPRELTNPSSDGGLSDDIQTPGVQVQVLQVQASEPDQVSDHDYNQDDSDYEMEEEEDSFDITLRTPYNLRTRRSVAAASPISRVQSNMSFSTAATAASSTDSDTMDTNSILSGLSTIRHAPTLRTTTSVASSVGSDDASSSSSRKRRLSSVTGTPPLPPVDSTGPRHPNTPRRRAVRASPPSLGARVTSAKTATLGQRRRPDLPEGKSAGSTDAESSSSTASKRRRLARPLARPVSQRHTISSAPAKRSAPTARKADTLAAKAPSARQPLRSAPRARGTGSRLPLRTQTVKPRDVERVEKGVAGG